jgi:hypothetical protein
MQEDDARRCTQMSRRGWLALDSPWDLAFDFEAETTGVDMIMVAWSGSDSAFGKDPFALFAVAS